MSHTGLGCKLLTSLLLNKNLPNHRKVKGATEKGMLKRDIWEMVPVQKRTDAMKAEFEEMVRRRVDEYPKFDYEYEMSVVRGRENTPEYVLGR